MGKVQLAAFVRVFAQKVTTVLCPMQALDTYDDLLPLASPRKPSKLNSPKLS